MRPRSVNRLRTMGIQPTAVPHTKHWTEVTMRTLVFGSLGLAVLFVAAATSSGDAPTPPEGFTAMFNGRDLTVWKGSSAACGCHAYATGWPVTACPNRG
jgi:hypothetical protein